MSFKSVITATVIAAASVAGAGLASAAPAVLHTGFVGSYATFEACAADGASPTTGGAQWECVEVAGGWDLYTY
ncbi:MULTISPECIES: hypothetical protein [unclassified Nocardia]|uniref:hypothetical protein n=1 Tax=unclassified Nocardia TaxID=2637762 RepID=UPI003665D207